GFVSSVYGVAASAIQVVIHNDDEGDKEKEEEIEDSEDSKNSMPIASSVNAGEGRGQRQLRGSHTLEITQTGILSNRRPSQRSGDPSSGGDRLVAAASNGNLLALAKREAAKRELYSRFSRGEVIFGDPLGGDLLDDDPPAKATDTADDHKAQERRRKEEKRARKEKRRLERETGREKAIKRRKRPGRIIIGGQIQRSPSSSTARGVLYDSQLKHRSELSKRQAASEPFSARAARSPLALVNFTKAANSPSAFTDSTLERNSVSKVSSASAPPSNHNRSKDQWPNSDTLLAFDNSELYERVNPSRTTPSGSLVADRVLLPRISSTMHQEANEPLNSADGTTTDSTILASGHVDALGSSFPSVLDPRGRHTRLNPSTPYRPPLHAQQHQSPGTNQGNPSFTSQQPPAHQGQQQQQFMLQQPSPTVYYPPFHPHSHLHMQQTTTPPSAYPVNQGYLGAPPHTSPGPSIPAYAYSQPYPTDHSMHGYGFHAMGGMTPAQLHQYPESESHQHQSTHSLGHRQQGTHGHETGSDVVQGYLPMMVTTSAPYAYSIPAFAPTGGPTFTPQYRTGPLYSQYQPLPAQGYSPGYPQGPIQQMHRPPPQRQHSHLQQHPQMPSSPSIYSPGSQNPPHRGYSPIVSSQNSGVSPIDPHTHTQAGSRNTAGSTNPGLRTGDGTASANTTNTGSFIFETRGSGHHQMFGSNDGTNIVDQTRSGGGTPLRRSNIPGGGDGYQSSFSYTGKDAQSPSMLSQANQGRTSNEGDADQDAKAKRSDWVMWIGNVPGDATLDELYTFFGQGPPPTSARTDRDDMADDVGDGQAEVEAVGVAFDRTQGQTTSKSDEIAGEMSSANAAGVVSVFLISRSNCAFVNYATEEHLRRAVEWYNGKPLRDPQVDPRCPKLVCRVRKKGDDLKAGVGGQRGIGIHARWVKDTLARRRSGLSDQHGEEGQHRPPLVHGGPASGSKKSSSGSGSSVSHASTTSSLLATYFPSRYFIIKSLTQDDVDLSVQTGLWATQMHNQETLDQAYRTSQTVYLIFSVNKSGEFFGYAIMDGPISLGERNPSVEWSSRETTSTSKLSPATRRSNLVQPTIEEERESAPSDHLSEHAEKGDKANIEASPTSKQPPGPLRGIRHTWGVESLGKQREEYNAKQHQISEPLNAYRDRAREEPNAESRNPTSPKPDGLSANPLAHSSMQHLLSGHILQDSPDPLTPGEDEKMRSLGGTPSGRLSSHKAQDKSTDDVPRPGPARPSKPALSIASAPPEMDAKHKRLSLATPVLTAGTWDENRKGSQGPHDDSIEEEQESESDGIFIRSAPQSPGVAPLSGGLESAPVLKRTPAARASSRIAGLPPQDAEPGQEQVAIDGLTSKEPAWGTSFKVKWIQTKPLPFSRTRHLRNPWNHNREVKVSRDGTEVEPTVGKQLVEEWDRPEGVSIAPKGPAAPSAPVSPISPTQPYFSAVRGRRRGFPGRPQRDIGQ
ncbi:hypothetical protein FRC17_010808, partial [Serendipita sp. 399]